MRKPINLDPLTGQKLTENDYKNAEEHFAKSSKPLEVGLAFNGFCFDEAYYILDGLKLILDHVKVDNAYCRCYLTAEPWPWDIVKDVDSIYYELPFILTKKNWKAYKKLKESD